MGMACAWASHPLTLVLAAEQVPLHHLNEFVLPTCMTPHWLNLRWPVTALTLGGMALAGLVRLTHNPIKVKLELNFTEPLQISGKVKGELTMQRAVQFEPTGSLVVKVAEQAPIDLSVTNRTPVQVQIRNAQPIQVKVDESKPIQVDMDPQAPVEVKVGL